MMSRFQILIKVAFIGSYTLFALSCNQIKSDNNNDTNSLNQTKGTPDIQFDTLFYDFGNLVEGEKVSYIFKFKNTGTSDLIIFDAYSTCGCTVPNYSNEPLKPGDEGQIEVIFDSSGRNGMQYKNITLKLNTPMREKTLTIKANVKPSKSNN